MKQKYFSGLKRYVATVGTAEIPAYIKLLFLQKIVNADYEKDYFQVIEIKQEENQKIKVTIKQEEVDETIKENKITFDLQLPSIEFYRVFNDIKKLYLIEDEEYQGVIIQTLLLPEEY